VTEPTPYERFGGSAFFTNLIGSFYAKVATDPILRPMYPQDLTGAEWRLRAFLEQYWGGPTDYSDERGHPRLRMRHADFAIDTAARTRWIELMGQAVAEQNMAAAQEVELWRYLTSAAIAMQNIPDETRDHELPASEL
jgi:hemoglobin